MAGLKFKWRFSPQKKPEAKAPAAVMMPPEKKPRMFKKRTLKKEALKEQIGAARAAGVSRRERIVLLVGDEGAVLAHMKKGKLVNRMFSPAPEAAETQNMLEMLKRTPRVPFFIVFDTMDQSYVQQSLPPVTALSVDKMVKRRLERDFSSEYIKGAFLLGRDKGGNRDWQFMMSAVQQTTVVKGWLDVATEWPNRCQGILLLPAEAAALFTRLNEVLRKHRGSLEGKVPDWQIFVTYNKVSGIRQMVFQSGTLTLTRLSQPAVDSTVETIAGTIEQEIVSTKEYLKRLSTQVEGGVLHVLILGSEDICRHIDVNKLQVTNVEAVTPFQAAEMLKLPGAAQPTDRFSDSLLCAMLATSAKRRLVLTVPALEGQKAFSMGIYAQRGLAACITAWLVFSIGSMLWDMYGLSGDLSDLRRQQAIKSQALEELKKKLPRSPDEMERIITMMQLVDVLDSESYAPDNLLKELSQNFGQRIHVTELDWELREPTKGGAHSAPPPARRTAGARRGAPPTDGPQAAIVLTLEFPPAIAKDRVKMQQEITDILNQFKGKFPTFDVSYTALPSIVSDTGRIDVDLSQQQQDDKPPENAQVQAKLQLIGPADTAETGESSGGDQEKNTNR